MILGTSEVKCTAKQKPKVWNQGGRSGITYRVTVSDGESALDLRCKDEETYQKFEPWESYHVLVNVVQAAQDDRIVERLQIVDAQVL